MDILLYLTRIANGVLMITIGIGFGIIISRKFQLGWRLWWIGAATFILSQAGHIPFNYGITWLSKHSYLPAPPETGLLYVNAILLGLSSGIWEEFARYFMYRWWVKDARTWSKALLAGSGHGGIEAIVLGILVLLAFFQMVAYRNVDISTFVPAEQVANAQLQIQSYWSVPWYETLLGAVERAFALCLHIANSVMVLQVFTRKQFRWVWFAIGWHAVINAVAVIANSTWGPYITEGILGAGAIISVMIIFALRSGEEPIQSTTPLIPLGPLKINPLDDSTENIENSRYNQ